MVLFHNMEPGSPSFPENKQQEKKPSEVSLELYAKENNVEYKPIEFICLPCRHDGDISADLVIANIKTIQPDLVLFEDIHGSEETDFVDSMRKLQESGHVDTSFNGRVLKYLTDSNIEVKPLNGSFKTEKQARDFAQEMMDSFDFGHTLMKVKEIKDDEESWGFIKNAWDVHVKSIVNLQKKREEDTLSNIAPTIFSSSNISNIRKVAVLFGSDHTSAFFNTLHNRGEKVSLVRDDFSKYDTSGDFSSLESPSFFLWSFLAPFGGEIAQQARTLYEFEKTFGKKVITIEKVKALFIKLKHGSLTVGDIMI